MTTQSEGSKGTLTLEDGFQIKYTVIGAPVKPVLLFFVVGSSGLGSLYYHLAQELSKDFQCIYYDKRGFLPANSDNEAASRQKNPLVLAERHADDAAELLKHASPYRSACVFGTSTGGTAVLDLAMRYPDLVHTAVLHEPITFSVVQPQTLREEMLTLYRNVARDEDPAKGFAVFADYMFNAPGEVIASGFKAPSANAVEVYNSRQGQREAMSMVEYHVDESRLGSVSSKIILIFGEDSIDLRVSAPGRALAHLLGQRKFWKLSGGHLSFAKKKHAPSFCDKLVLILAEEGKMDVLSKRRGSRM